MLPAATTLTNCAILFTWSRCPRSMNLLRKFQALGTSSFLLPILTERKKTLGSVEYGTDKDFFDSQGVTDVPALAVYDSMGNRNFIPSSLLESIQTIESALFVWVCEDFQNPHSSSATSMNTLRLTFHYSFECPYCLCFFNTFYEFAKILFQKQPPSQVCLTSENAQHFSRNKLEIPTIPEISVSVGSVIYYFKHENKPRTIENLLDFVQKSQRLFSDTLEESLPTETHHILSKTSTVEENELMNDSISQVLLRNPGVHTSSSKELRGGEEIEEFEINFSGTQHYTLESSKSSNFVPSVDFVTGLEKNLRQLRGAWAKMLYQTPPTTLARMLDTSKLSKIGETRPFFNPFNDGEFIIHSAYTKTNSKSAKTFVYILLVSTKRLVKKRHFPQRVVGTIFGTLDSQGKCRLGVKNIETVLSEKQERGFLEISSTQPLFNLILENLH